jgi:hypothetical protein|tara:strand:- start:1250 stop:1525 length:276 start_codon:yes stop_codon:yes gene_type:complete
MSKINDKIINRVIDKIQKRAEAGYKKYGVGLDKDEQSLDTWLNHLQEELMDAANYIEKIRAVLIEEDKKISKYPESSWTSDTTDQNWDVTY